MISMYIPFTHTCIYIYMCVCGGGGMCLSLEFLLATNLIHSSGFIFCIILTLDFAFVQLLAPFSPGFTYASIIGETIVFLRHQ